MKIRRKYPDLYEADFNFSALRGKDRRYLQAVLFYEYARECAVTRKRLKLWLDPKVPPDDLWALFSKKAFVVWKAQSKTDFTPKFPVGKRLYDSPELRRKIAQFESCVLPERPAGRCMTGMDDGVFIRVFRLAYGAGFREAAGSIGIGVKSTEKARVCRPAEERAYLKVRLRDTFPTGGIGCPHLTELAKQLVADIPWVEIDKTTRDHVLRRAQRRETEDGDFPMRVAKADRVIELAHKVIPEKITSLWRRGEITARGGVETLALKVKWDQTDDRALIKRFAELVAAMRPAGFDQPNPRAGRKKSSILTHLDNLGIMRALSVMPWREVNDFRNRVGLWKRSNTPDNHNEAVRIDLEKKRSAAINRFKSVFGYAGHNQPIHSKRYAPAAKR